MNPLHVLDTWSKFSSHCLPTLWNFPVISRVAPGYYCLPFAQTFLSGCKTQQVGSMCSARELRRTAHDKDGRLQNRYKFKKKKNKTHPTLKMVTGDQASTHIEREYKKLWVTDCNNGQRPSREECTYGRSREAETQSQTRFQGPHSDTSFSPGFNFWRK